MFRISLWCSILVVAAGLAQNSAFAETGRIARTLEKILDQADEAGVGTQLDWDRLRAFYSQRKFRQAWTDRFGPGYRAQQFRHAIANAERDGLDPADYHLQQIHQRWGQVDSTALAQLELLLSNAYLSYAHDMYRGRYEPFEFDPAWHIQLEEIDELELLQAAMDADDFGSVLRQLPPPHIGYRWLRDALQHYRQLERQGGWPVINSGVILEYGQTHPAVAVLRQRLLAEGDLTLRPVRHAEYFDQALKYAVERFQSRHGLHMDGIVGPTTLSALNVPISTRIEQIKINMERWRWLPREMGDNYILVNSAGFDLLVVERGEPAFGMSVITGTPERPTPALQGMLHSIVLNPDWTVPRTIAVEDILPEQQRNPAFLSSRGIRVYYQGQELDPAGIDWSGVDRDHFPYILRQDPGPKNPLGRIKFLFTNEFAVYLHDTPSRQLFNESVRAYSSGCIRVQEPYKLAGYLLRNNPQWTEQRIRDVVRSGETQSVPISESIPIYLIYFTAWVGNDGAMAFYDDVYKLDQILPSVCASSP